MLPDPGPTRKGVALPAKKRTKRLPRRNWVKNVEFWPIWPEMVPTTNRPRIAEWYLLTTLIFVELKFRILYRARSFKIRPWSKTAA